MSTFEIDQEIADLAVKIELAIRAAGQLPSNRAHLRYVHGKLSEAKAAMSQVNHTNRMQGAN